MALVAGIKILFIADTQYGQISPAVWLISFYNTKAEQFG